MKIDSDSENNLREYYQTLSSKYGDKLVQALARDGAFWPMPAFYWGILPIVRYLSPHYGAPMSSVLKIKPIITIGYSHIIP
jgi:hypothetical protein